MSRVNRIPTDLCERVFAALVPFYQCDINCLLEFQGRVEAERLKQAFLAALADEPMWSHRFATSFWKPAWVPIPRADRDALFEIMPTGDDWQPAFDELVRKPVEAAARLFVFRGPSNDTLCFRVDHRLADATASRFLIDAVAAHYHAGNSPIPEDRPVQRRTMALLQSQVSEKQRDENLQVISNYLKTVRKFPAAFRLPPVTAADPADRPPMLFYPDGALEQLTQRAMRDRITPTVALMAATYLSVRDVLGNTPQVPVSVGTMVDLRRYLPATDAPATASMLIGQVRMRVEEAGATTMPAVVEQLRLRMAEQRGPQFGLRWSPLTADVPRLRFWLNNLPFGLFRWAAHRKARTNKATPDVMVSDLGKFGSPDDRWGPATLRNAYATAGIWGIPSISVCTSTCGTRLTIAVGAAPRSLAERLAAALRQRLNDYVGWTTGTP